MLYNFDQNYLIKPLIHKYEKLIEYPSGPLCFGNKIVLLNQYLKSEEEKTRHFVSFIAHQISILKVKCIKQGQNKVFKASIWGVVRFCRSNITWDMIEKLKNWFFKKNQFLHFSIVFHEKMQKNSFSVFFIISQVIFDLQKRTLPHTVR